MEMLFWIAFVTVLYTYVGYPLIIALWSRFHPAGDKASLDKDHMPELTVVIAAYNEADNLARKVESINASDYPQEKIGIVVVSDGSTDGTEAVLKPFANVRLLSHGERRGKPAAINTAMAVVDTPLVVFTDARQTLKADAITQQVTALADEGIGAVSGELVQMKASSNEGASVGLYWKYEKWIRKNESQVHSVPGVSGALYAIRAADFVPLAEDTILDDFEIPIRILQKGRMIKFQSGAIMYDRVEESSSKEKQRKVRTLLGNYQSFSRNLWLFNPMHNPIWFQFMSHKVLRLMVPYWMAIMVIAPLFLEGVVYTLFFIAESGFYIAVAAAKAFPATKHNRYIGFCHVFWDMNISAVIALKRYLLDEVNIKWTRT
jgi:cellulose synthase/poly-beta-1,6-N-acetylglucosamine synthase-like glycosyltransferase